MSGVIVLSGIQCWSQSVKAMSEGDEDGLKTTSSANIFQYTYSVGILN